MAHETKTTRGAARPSRAAIHGLTLACALAAPLAGCVGYDGDMQTGYVLDDRLVQQVRPGSSAEQVLVVLGTPSTTSTIGGSAWYYVSAEQKQDLAFQKPTVVERRILAVYFDPQKHVERVATYGPPFLLFPTAEPQPPRAKTASSSRATMLVILIAGFTAGPAVSL